ncbi:AMIN-like domain-containing (lipo)protein [Corynebacterium aquilae]|nr:hypothetical protein [Corynebacterium aquilae]
MTTHASTARQATLSILALAAAGSLVACSATDTASTSTTAAEPKSIAATSDTSTMASTATTRPSADAGLTPLGNANKEMKTLRPEAPSNLVVTGVRLGTHQGFDRVVFDLSGQGQPGWFIDYVDAPTQQASGLPLKTAGDTFLDVGIDGTAYPFEAGIKEPNLAPVDGPGPIVAQVTSGGTFEGRSQFIIGLNGGQHPYSVQVLTNPTRLVIDISQEG